MESGTCNRFVNTLSSTKQILREVYFNMASNSRLSIDMSHLNNSAFSLLDLMEKLQGSRCPQRKTELLKLSVSGVRNITGDVLRSSMQSPQLSHLFDQIIELAIPPEFTNREYFTYEKDDFSCICSRTEVVLNFLCAYFDACSKNTVFETKSIDNCVPKLLVVISSNIRSNLWSTDIIHQLNLLVLNHLRILYKVDSLSDLLLMDIKSSDKAISTPSSNLIGRYLMSVKSRLTKDNWQKNPTFVESFIWMLTQMIKFPHLSEYLDFVLSPSLNFIDSHDVTHKVFGIQCLHHIACNVSGEELRWYGRADVVYAALKQQIYSRDPSVLQCLHPALLTVLPIVDKDPLKHSSVCSSKEIDRVLSVIITNAETENGIVLRRLYSQSIADFVDILGIQVVRHLGKLLHLVSDYLEVYDGPEETSRLNTLRILKSLFKNAWPRIPSHADCILKTLLKLLQDVVCDQTMTTDTVKNKLKKDAVECLVLFKELCPLAASCIQEVCRTEELSDMVDVLKEFT